VKGSKGPVEGIAGSDRIHLSLGDGEEGVVVGVR